ncbi:MAG TPA: PH domain-containing protein [Gemmatimonadaceae bacterium]|nr:PH domain-containing protein [Gemmatimonadaceae bacterium]
MTQSDVEPRKDAAPGSDISPDGDGAPRRLHPLTLLFASLRLARQLILPAVIAAFSRAEGDPARIATWVIGVLAVPALVISTLRYMAFRYRLGSDELVIDSGVLRRQHRVIPLSRVQNIDLRESALQRVLGVVEMHVETAGTGRGAEGSLEVLGRDEAAALRTELLARRRAVREAARELAPAGEIGGAREGAEENAIRARTVDDQAAAPVQVLALLGTGRLAVAGATANEAGLIAAALAALFQFVDEAVIARYLPILTLAERIREATLFGTIWLIAVALASLLIIGWVLSIAGSVIGYHGFTLERVGGELRKRYGLFGRRHTTVPIERVQGIRVEESLLRRPFGLATIKIETAGGSPGERRRSGAEAFVPIVSVAEVAGLVRGVFGDLDLGAARIQRVHPRSRRRAFLRYGVLSVILFVLVIAVSVLRDLDPTPAVLWWIPVLLGAAWLLAAWQYRHRGYALLPGYALARSGVLNRITWIVPNWKIQTVHRTATPFQRRHGLSTLLIDTASGGRQGRVTDLGADVAEPMVEELALRARRTTGGW